MGMDLWGFHAVSWAVEMNFSNFFSLLLAFSFVARKHLREHYTPELAFRYLPISMNNPHSLPMLICDGVKELKILI